MHTALEISGALSKRDAKRLTTAIRGSSIGPTTLYYAGVTAPIIGAGVAVFAQALLRNSQMSSYWVVMSSAILASLAGIVWYLIFIRWSYRHQHGRAGEMERVTHVELTDDALIIRRDLVETRIDWDAIDEIKSKRSFTIITFNGAEPLMLPHDWFGEKTACEIFMRRLGQCMKSG